MVKNSRYLVSGSADGVIKIWDMEDGTTLDQLTAPAPAPITALAFVGPLMVSQHVTPGSCMGGQMIEMGSWGVPWEDSLQLSMRAMNPRGHSWM